MKKTVLSLIITALCALMALPAAAQFKDADAAIDYREAVMILFGHHFGGLAPMAKKEVPFDADQVKRTAALLDQLKDLPWKAYGEGTQGGYAKDSIWDNPDDFKQHQEQFIEAIGAFSDAAQKEDFNSFRAAFGEVGKNCKACHDDYRERL